MISKYLDQKKKKVSNTPLDSPSISKKKKDCHGDCCQSKVIPDKGYTTRSITSKKIAITLLSIDRGSIDTKPWIGYLVGRHFVNGFEFFRCETCGLSTLDPFTPVIHYPIRGGASAPTMDDRVATMDGEIDGPAKRRPLESPRVDLSMGG